MVALIHECHHGSPSIQIENINRQTPIGTMRSNQRANRDAHRSFTVESMEEKTTVSSKLNSIQKPMGVLRLLCRRTSAQLVCWVLFDNRTRHPALPQVVSAICLRSQYYPQTKCKTAGPTKPEHPVQESGSYNSPVEVPVSENWNQSQKRDNQNYKTLRVHTALPPTVSFSQFNSKPTGVFLPSSG